MRFVVGSLMSVLLSASLAVANDTPPPTPIADPTPVDAGRPAPSKPRASLRVVRVMTDSNQALLFDKATKKHVLVEVDTLINGYTVDAIEDDAVILRAQGSELVLSAPERPRRGRTARTETAFVEGDDGVAIARKPARTSVEPNLAPVDPYAGSTATTAPASAIVAPASDDSAPITEARTVTTPAPITAGQGGVRVSKVNPHDGTTPLSNANPADPYADDPYADEFDPAPAPSIIQPAAPAVVEPPKPVITPTVIAKSELNAALADFTKLTSMVRGTFTEQGVQITGVAQNSVFAKAGLRAGDTVVAVDQTKLLTLDDAAELYSRASATKAANIQVLRAGKSMTLRVLFH